VVALYAFEGERGSDLPFRRGEELFIIAKPEACWWTAQNALGQTGFIPSTYVQSAESLRTLSPTGSSLSESSNKRDSGASSDMGGAILDPNDSNANPLPTSPVPDAHHDDHNQVRYSVL
uniref:SH3 domain-containing protein n=1 Tax=Plectus sambesii TaxID=2011161 RepID=A0A914UVT1_9BILA